MLRFTMFTSFEYESQAIFNSCLSKNATNKLCKVWNKSVLGKDKKTQQTMNDARLWTPTDSKMSLIFTLLSDQKTQSVIRHLNSQKKVLLLTFGENWIPCNSTKGKHNVIV